MELFELDGKPFTLEDLLKDIYLNSKEKQKNIINTFEGLRPFVQTLQDAVILMPTLVNLQEVGVKNDDQLVKLAAIMSRVKAKSKEKSSIDDLLSPEEKKMILNEATVLAHRLPGPAGD